MNCAQKLNFDRCLRENKLNSTDVSTETSGCDMSDSFNSLYECLSPIPTNIVPRKLDFSEHDGDNPETDELQRPTAAISPPYKRVRALRLFDSPATPKTLLEKCSTPQKPRTRLIPPRLSGNGMKLLSNQSLLTTSDDSALELDTSRAKLQPPSVNINPFTPSGQLLNKKKRALSKTPQGSPWGDTTPEQPAKRLKESNISRYKAEFEEIEILGAGQFGVVSLCAHRLDGCRYAIKRSLRPVAGSGAERAALNEVYAHAVLGKHPHVVRYYSAWSEDDHMIIQNEYCSGGSLQQLMARVGPMPEAELRIILNHVAKGLRYIHSKHLVHMDIKPANIFVCTEQDEVVTSSSDCDGEETATSSSDDGENDDDDGGKRRSRTREQKKIYKIGDLGHVTCSWSAPVEEGDCRYLPLEVLHEDYSKLTRADIFALGLTLYEAGGGGPLPKNGEEWHAIRNGKLPDLPQCSREFNQLLKRMVSPSPRERPSASRLARPAASPLPPAQHAQIARDLALRNEMLSRKLHEAAKCIKLLAPQVLEPRTRRQGARPKSTSRRNSILQDTLNDVLKDIDSQT